MRTVAGAVVRSAFTPYVTYALMAVNILVFAVTVLQSGSVRENSRGSSLFESWVLWAPGVAQGQFVRVVGSGFLHFGPIHILVNMFALYLVGRNIELVLGRVRYLSVYLVSLLGGSAAVLVLQTDNAATAGASGAIFGLFGAEAIILIRQRQSPGPVLVVIAINVIISVSLPGISLWGHLGGLAAGTAAAAGLLFGPRLFASGNRPATDRSALLAGWISIAAVAAVTLVAICVRVLQLRSQYGLA